MTIAAGSRHVRARAQLERGHARLVATQELLDRLTRRPSPAAWTRVRAMLGSELVECLRRDLDLLEPEPYRAGRD